MEFNKDNLENALNSNNSEAQKNQSPGVSKDMEVGYHQGALDTLAAEKAGLLEMIHKVESIMQAHAQRLQQLGFDVKFANKSQ